jgi:hypothetical protein
MDAHAATIPVAVVEAQGAARSMGVIANRPEAMKRLIGKLGEASTPAQQRRAAAARSDHQSGQQPSQACAGGGRMALPTPPGLSNRQRALQRELSPQVLETAWNAQLRLSRRYARLSGRGKPAGNVVTAVARELVGFIWAIGRAAGAAALQTMAA